MLKDFLIKHQKKIEKESRRLFLQHSVPKPTERELGYGIPIVIEQIIDSLPRDKAKRQDSEIVKVAAEHGARLFGLGFTVSQVIYAYGAVCETIMNLVDTAGISVKAKDFEVLNAVLDIASAEAITEYEEQRNQKTSQQEVEHLGILAHELRNALSSAIAAHEVISSGQVGSAGRTAEVLDHSLSRMRDLIDRELGEVRLRTDSEPVVEHLRLAELLDEVAATRRHEAVKRGIEFSVEVMHELEFETDPQLLISIVSNLIQNAFKYTDTGGRVWVRGYVQNEHVVIEVEDTCGGIPEDKFDKIFEPFRRATTKQPGIGLGLSIVKRAVQALNGEVAVRNVPGKGCSFRVEFPPKLYGERAA
jgi:signal transduction histidine kinase